MLLFVFPHGATATIGFAKLAHRLNDVVVLGVRRLSLVATEIPTSPRRNETRFLRRKEEPVVPAVFLNTTEFDFDWT